MSGSSRSRQKRKLEPISIEELAGTTGMSGFCTFLTRDNSVGVPALDQLDPVPESSAPIEEPSAPDSGAADIGGPGLPAPESKVLGIQSGAPEISAAVSSAADLGAPPSEVELEIAAFHYSNALPKGAPVSATVEATAPVFRRRPRIREAATVHEGHSLAEQAVYEAMYRSGRPYQGETRILTIGLRTLAEISRMAYSNCKANVRSLVSKLALDERPGFSYTEGRTYLIYGLDEILRRRKAAGLTHVVRTRGVAFVDPQTGVPLPVRYTDPEDAPVSTAPNTVSGVISRFAVLETTQSSAPEQIADVLRRYLPEADLAAATDLWRRCRENAADAQVQEVAHFIELKAGKPGLRMPLGFLLSAVPRCFQADALSEYRRHSATARERQFASELLASPDADEEQRQWAKDLLADTP